MEHLRQRDGALTDGWQDREAKDRLKCLLNSDGAAEFSRHFNLSFDEEIFNRKDLSDEIRLSMGLAQYLVYDDAMRPHENCTLLIAQLFNLSRLLTRQKRLNGLFFPSKLYNVLLKT